MCCFASLLYFWLLKKLFLKIFIHQKLIARKKNKNKNLTNLTTKTQQLSTYTSQSYTTQSTNTKMPYDILSQCLYLHKNFSLIFSIISLGNGKLKYSLQSFIISIFDDLNNFIKNRVTTKSSERRSALSKE